jgi:hypothetical protein
VLLGNIFEVIGPSFNRAILQKDQRKIYYFGADKKQALELNTQHAMCLPKAKPTE